MNSGRIEIFHPYIGNRTIYLRVRVFKHETRVHALQLDIGQWSFVGCETDLYCSDFNVHLQLNTFHLFSF